jgi:hypothetical protein
VSTPKVPPEIARKIAALKAAPGAAPGKPAPAPAPRVAPPRSGGGSGGSIIGILAAVGWLVAVAAGGAAYLIRDKAEGSKQAALAEQAASYDAQIAQLKADAAAELKKLQDATAAQQLVLQTELDFAKLPEIPLETVFRGNQVLFISNNSKDEFVCKVRLFRPIGGVSREVDFRMKGGGYQDIAALDNWLFAKGDRLEFVKSGFKPRSLVVP